MRGQLIKLQLCERIPTISKSEKVFLSVDVIYVAYYFFLIGQEAFELFLFYYVPSQQTIN